MNFNESISRIGTSSVKWEMTKELFGAEGLLPMWVADMDFRPPSEVAEAIKERTEHGVFGYTFVPPSVHKAIHDWLLTRHSWEVRHSWLLFSPGVVPSISTAINAFTLPGDKVLVQTPVYTPFFEMAELNGREVESAPLSLQNGRYDIDFAAFEESLKKGCKLFLLCSPHNPGGRVWTREELLKMGRLCKKYNCLIVSDEIHSDIILGATPHTPTASLDEDLAQQTITLIAPSKTFNLAGLQASAVIIPNEILREKFSAVQKAQGFFTLNIFGITAIEAAYRHGSPWLDGLVGHIRANTAAVREFLEENLPTVRLVEPDAGYLLWLDCRQLGLTGEQLLERLVHVGKLALEPGQKYGANGEGFVRMNIACTTEVLADGLSRFKKALGELQKPDYAETD